MTEVGSEVMPHVARPPCFGAAAPSTLRALPSNRAPARPAPASAPAPRINSRRVRCIADLLPRVLRSRLRSPGGFRVEIDEGGDGILHDPRRRVRGERG